MPSDSGDSARAWLIKTRRGVLIDESLLPAARQECLKLLQEAARELEDQGILEMLRGEREHLEGSPLDDFIYSRDRHRLMWGALYALHDKLLNYRLPEEEKAWTLANEARENGGMCGCCGRELPTSDPAYIGAEVYVGMQPLFWNMIDKPRICEARYERTVLCGSCAPDWLQERDDVVTQLCAHCERPRVSPLKLSELGNAFCCNRCQRAYDNRLDREKRAKERKKICEVCGEEFIATRRDAKTCSDKCKQKLYRQRKKKLKKSQ